MSRELEYRAWHKIEKKMIYFSLGEMLGNYCDEYNYCSIADTDLYRWHDSDELETMEYAGFKDKKGIKIYEDDIVKGTGSPMRVVFLDGSFVLMDRDMEKRGVWTDMRIFEDAAKTRTIWEIIGNVHDNPELLEV